MESVQAASHSKLPTASVALILQASALKNLVLVFLNLACVSFQVRLINSTQILCSLEAVNRNKRYTITTL